MLIFFLLWLALAASCHRKFSDDAPLPTGPDPHGELLASPSPSPTSSPLTRCPFSLRRHADRVLSPFHPQAMLAINGVHGAGNSEGSRDVFSLDNSSDGSLILGWSGGLIGNGPGSDFVVFENVFHISGDLYFVEPAVVSVSLDGVLFVDFPHKMMVEKPNKIDLRRRANWQGFAGLNPVRYHEEQNGQKDQCIDPFDLELSGGDHFDLDVLGDSPEEQKIKTEGFRYLKITATCESGADCKEGSCSKVPCLGYSDIDGVYAKYFKKEVL